jgi:hypothetical protein
MRYQLTEVPAHEFLSYIGAWYPDTPPDKLQQLSEAAAAIFNTVVWCEINQMPIGYLDLLEIARQKTCLKGAKLFIATAAATRAANLTFEEQRQL